MLSKKNWESRKSLVDRMVLTAGFGALLESPNKQFFDGSFIHYAESLRKERLKKDGDFENINLAQ